MTLAKALSRTILLAQTALVDGTPDEHVLDALTAVNVVLVARENLLVTHAGQSAFITAALLMARSGHAVWLDAPNLPLVGRQPPLEDGGLIPSLIDIGQDLLPTREFYVGLPEKGADLVVLFGDASWAGDADCVLRIAWSEWGASIAADDQTLPITHTEWPIGGMAAAALAAAEAFKMAMRRLRGQARALRIFDRQFAPALWAEVVLAPNETAQAATLGSFDMISGGAIANAALYALLRLPDVSGDCRILDQDVSATSNLNRNMLLRRSRLDILKVDDLSGYGLGLVIDPVPIRFEGAASGQELRSHVLVGVDDIRSRWRVQELWPSWLGVGATDGFDVQVSSHNAAVPCVGCLHPEEATATGEIPTVAFVSFWAGLVLATGFARHRVRSFVMPDMQQTLFTALRPETFRSGPVPARGDCPVGCDFAQPIKAL